jgi:nucleoside 2-deoxyribosyltransferase
MRIVNPFDHSPNIEGSESAKVKLSAMVKDVCIGLLEACDVVVALTDWNDTGVAFEAGYAHSLHIPVVLISQGRCAEANAMLLGSAAMMFDYILDEGRVEALVTALEEYLISRAQNSEERHTH